MQTRYVRGEQQAQGFSCLSCDLFLLGVEPSIFKIAGRCIEGPVRNLKEFRR